MRWISCKNRLPAERTTVLVDGGIAQLIDGIWYTGMEEPLFRRCIMWEVTHWQPLPKAPVTNITGTGVKSYGTPQNYFNTSCQ